ncbi:MAG: AAA family ATPase [Myxococcales bacterium]|nr:AAA family ATPase [Myxococcales bacterium]
MKTRILRIHVRNLASLAGDHVVDLEHGALADAGIFPIVGPTGAGKSTLLDGVCLALFKQLPRLPSSGSKGDGGLTPSDTRHAIRRGAGEGFAEVDFLGRDGRRYRAKWEAHRARSRPDGAWQTATHTLQDLQTQKLLGDGKRETVALIEQRLGLGYDELVRSMLLPQGEFARLLHAKADERAKLLEKLTRTTIYARLSERAAARRSEARRAVENLDARLGEVRALPDEDRARLDSEISDLEQVAGELRALAEASAKAERRWQELQQRETEVQDAERAAMRAEEALAARAPLRDALALAERCLPAELPLEAVRLVSKQAAESSARRDACANDRANAEQELEAASQGRSDAISARRQAEATLERVAPELQTAMHMDLALRDADRELQHVREDAQRAAKARGDQEHELARHVDEHQTNHLALEALVRALDADVEGASLVERWPTLRGEVAAWCALLDERIDHAKRVEERQRDLERVTAETEVVAGEHASLEAQVARARAALDESERHVDACVQRLGAHEPEARLRDRQDALRRLRDAEQELAYATAQLEARASEAAELTRALGSLRDAASEAKAEQERATAELRAAEGRLEQARRIDLATSLRGALRSGEACPVCGSCEHPGVPATVPTSALEQVCDEARAAQERAAECARACERELASNEARAEAATRAAREAGVDLDGRHRRAAELRDATGVATGAVQGALADVAQKLRAISDDREALEAARTEHATRTKRHGMAVDARSALLARKSELAQRAERARGSLDALRAGLERVATDEASRREALARVLRHTPTRATEGELSKRVDERRALEEEHQRLEARASNLESQLALLRHENDKRRDDETGAVARLEHASAQVEILRLARRGVLDGRAVSEVEKELRDAVDVARRAEATAETRFGAAEARLHETQRSLDARAHEAREQALALEAAERAVDEAVARIGLRRELVVDVVTQWPRARVATELKKLGEVDRAHTEARAVLGRAREALSEHRARCAEGGGIDELESVARRRPYCDDAVAKANDELATRRSRRREDDGLRTRQSELLDAREKAMARLDLFDCLVTVIGSGQGASNHLSRFAQGMALELLVEAANLQLDRLAPRFRLQRVGDLDLELVDRDLADEARPVHGLSGGETFLVSLALALGLASLAGDDLDLGSLFVDEGFGSLDPETLETALAALEAIHAEGVQVAIISHVEGLAERFSASVVVRRVAPGRSVVEVRG